VETLAGEVTAGGLVAVTPGGGAEAPDEPPQAASAIQARGTHTSDGQSPGFID
jgi:hypothetical protein